MSTTSQIIFYVFLGLLWCAPERLREEPYCPHINHKHDVYSFAIILQECHTREGAWSGTYMEPQGTCFSPIPFLFA